MNNIGTIIYGFCNGFFGRDDYSTKIIVYETSNSICCKYIENEHLNVAIFEDETEKQKYINEWKVRED